MCGGTEFGCVRVCAQLSGEVAVSINMAMGGTATCLVFKKYKA